VHGRVAQTHPYQVEASQRRSRRTTPVDADSGQIAERGLPISARSSRHRPASSVSSAADSLQPDRDAFAQPGRARRDAHRFRLVLAPHPSCAHLPRSHAHSLRAPHPQPPYSSRSRRTRSSGLVRRWSGMGSKVRRSILGLRSAAERGLPISARSSAASLMCVSPPFACPFASGPSPPLTRFNLIGMRLRNPAVHDGMHQRWNVSLLWSLERGLPISARSSAASLMCASPPFACPFASGPSPSALAST
jgi:hypothetical protein